jgi:diaminopimelate epimerase
MAELPFAKGQALGNDYLVLDAADLPWRLTPGRVRALCDRHGGIGSDGALLAVIGAGRFQLRIFNPDGTEAEKSGNGLRIFAAYLHDHGLVGDEPFRVELPGDAVTMQVLGPSIGGALEIIAEMGHASFHAETIGFRPGTGEVAEAELDLGDGLTAHVHPVSLGNPHCVVQVDALDRADFLRRAPRLATHTAFAAGTNVQFARVTGPASLEAWIFERGAGETLASGSSACAVAAVAYRQGWVGSREVEIEMNGGAARVEVRADGMISLQGPAQIVYRGVIRQEVLSAWY